MLASYNDLGIDANIYVLFRHLPVSFDTFLKENFFWLHCIVNVLQVIMQYKQYYIIVFIKKYIYTFENFELVLYFFK